MAPLRRGHLSGRLLRGPVRGLEAALEATTQDEGESVDGGGDLLHLCWVCISR